MDHELRGTGRTGGESILGLRQLYSRYVHDKAVRIILIAAEREGMYNHDSWSQGTFWRLLTHWLSMTTSVVYRKLLLGPNWGAVYL